ncbi:MAG TPA: penicillin-binding transpeptidase domain-containing protein [Dongiaceae bacterium]|nr:penicillin-binding transpeptidase domain-containing protein [Dongiaceae bacterium]
MLIFDQLRKNDPQLRTLALVVFGGLGVLLAGLWWVQVVSAQDYQDSLETQSYRTVRIPAVRGRILDRNRLALAENRPAYNISLYLEELSKPFSAACAKELAHARVQHREDLERQQKVLKRKLNKEERRRFALSPKERELLYRHARWVVASNVVAQISRKLGQPLSLDLTNFERHYETCLALPYPVLPNLTPRQIAIFEEQCTGITGVDLEMQSTRVYPYQTSAGHVLGYLQRDDSSLVGEEAFFSYRLPDYRGVLGIEGGYDKQLRGTAGAKSVLVNNVGYRQTENVWSVAEPGHNVVLTLDSRIQQAAERALDGVSGAVTRGAVVVMDVNTGDILALASSPAINPNYAVLGFPPGEWRRWQDPLLRPLINRATYENYQPGSIFKTIVAMACLEQGLDPKATIHNPGYIYVGRRLIHDLAAPGDYDFERAFRKSSNTYFITNGLEAGIANIVRLGQRLHLGEKIGLPTRQETAGTFPSWQRISAHWSDGDTANLCIGQGEVDVTPLQMAVVTSAIANDGKVLWPRLVSRIEPQDPASGEPPTVFPDSRVRDELGVKPSTLSLLRKAMLADVEDADGTGRKAAVPGLQVCGKTGTAQKKNALGVIEEDFTWFISFAPYEHPHYAVVVMVEVEHGGTGGGTCAPVAQKIYLALQRCDQGTLPKPVDLSENSRTTVQAP